MFKASAIPGLFFQLVQCEVEQSTQLIYRQIPNCCIYFLVFGGGGEVLLKHIVNSRRLISLVFWHHTMISRQRDELEITEESTYGKPGRSTDIPQNHGRGPSKNRWMHLSCSLVLPDHCKS